MNRAGIIRCKIVAVSYEIITLYEEMFQEDP
jgi:hypothetical protein